MIERDEFERLAAAVDALRRDVESLKQRCESQRKGFNLAIERIDRDVSNLRAAAMKLADHDRKRTEDDCVFATAFECLDARVSKLAARVDVLLRPAQAIQ